MTFVNKLVLYFPSPLFSMFLSCFLCPFLWDNYCCSAVFVVCFNKFRKAFMEPFSNRPTFEICLRNLLFKWKCDDIHPVILLFIDGISNELKF